MKKSAEVSKLPKDTIIEYEKNNRNKEVKQGDGLLGKMKWNNIKHILLLVLEKIVRKSRMVFLKLESKFDSWSKYIRSKKENRTKRYEKTLASKKDSDIMDRLSKYEFKNQEEPKFVRSKQNLENTEGESVEAEEVLVVNNQASKTKKPTEIKDRLEELLIERIAINPKDTEAYERLGEYYMEIESWTDAKECFKQVMKLDPKNRNAKYKIRRLESILIKR